ncbi:MAG TPA: LamG domain-containing protein, partial [Thermoanaerobaculia bacterium]|nr:LamG domain-containing protein [Thermoanaerobaculia bacterium]
AEGQGRKIDAELRATNVLSLALLVEPRSVARPAAGPIVALSYSDKDRGFLLRQNGRRLELVLRRSNEQGKLGGPGWTIAELPDGGPHHVAIRFSPGRIAAFLDGRPVFREVAPDGFFHWRNRALDFGSEVGGRERFRGLLSQIAIWNRELGDAEIAREAERALATVRGSAAPSRLEVEARLLARSAVPTLEQISPYRRALVVEEYESVRVLAGKPPAGRLRVARWAILDGERLPGAAAPLGTAAHLLLEPFDAQPQLESVVLSDTLPAAPRAPLHFEVGLGDG